MKIAVINHDEDSLDIIAVNPIIIKELYGNSINDFLVYHCGYTLDKIDWEYCKNIRVMEANDFVDTEFFEKD